MINYKSFVLIAILIMQLPNSVGAEFIKEAKMGSLWVCNEEIAAGFIFSDGVQNRKGFGWGTFSLKIEDETTILLHEKLHNLKFKFQKTHVPDMYVWGSGMDFNKIAMLTSLTGLEANELGQCCAFTKLELSLATLMSTGISGSMYKCVLQN